MKFFLNNEFIDAAEAKISVRDRGLLLGDGLFETFLAIGGDIKYLDEHLSRLQAGLDLFDIPLPISIDDLKNHMHTLLEHNRLAHDQASLRLTITRGPGARGITPPNPAQPTVLVTAAPYALNENQNHPAQYCISPIRRNEYSPCSRHKTLNYTDMVLARQLAQRSGYDEALLINSAGYLTCATTANIFFVKDGALHTPDLASGVLAGITRQQILSLARELGIPTIEKAITLDEWGAADEQFMTNSLIGVRPLGRALGSVGFKLAQAYGLG